MLHALGRVKTPHPNAEHTAPGKALLGVHWTSALLVWLGLATGCTAGADEVAAPAPEARHADSETASATDHERAPDSCREALDLTLVVDVSTSMRGELGAIAAGVEELWAAAQAAYTDVRVRMVAFVDDATTINACAPLESPRALREAVVHWQHVASADRQLVTPQMLNIDCPENSLDALALALKSCDLRSDARKLIVHITDDTFVEAPEILSKDSLQPGIRVQHTYADIAKLISEQDVYVSVFALREPRTCGAGRSSEVASGFFAARGDIPALPELVGGNATDLRRIRNGDVDLTAAIIRDSSAIRCGGLI